MFKTKGSTDREYGNKENEASFDFTTPYSKQTLQLAFIHVRRGGGGGVIF